MVSTFSLLPTGTERHILVLCDPHCRRLGIAKLNSTSLEIYVTLCFTGWPESDIMTDRRPLSVAFLLRIFALVPYTACSMGFRPTIVGTSIQLPSSSLRPWIHPCRPNKQAWSAAQHGFLSYNFLRVVMHQSVFAKKRGQNYGN